MFLKHNSNCIDFIQMLTMYILAVKKTQLMLVRSIMKSSSFMLRFISQSKQDLDIKSSSSDKSVITEK